MIKPFLTALILLGSINLFSQFAVEYNVILSEAGQNGGDYRIRGIFSNSEGVKDNQGNVYSFADILTDTSHYVFDANGTIFIIVGKGPNDIDGIDISNINGETTVPSTGSIVQITSIDSLTNEFFISAPVSSSIKAKIQRENLIRRFPSVIPDTLIGRAELLDSLANITGPGGSVNATFVRNEIADSLATIRPLIKNEEVIASFLSGATTSFYQLADDLDKARPITVTVNGFVEPFDTTNDGTGTGNVYYDPTLDRIIWKYSGYFIGDFVTINATKL